MLETLRRSGDGSYTLDAHDLYTRWCYSRGINRPHAGNFTTFYSEIQGAVRDAIPHALIKLGILTYGDHGGTGHFTIHAEGQYMAPLIEQVQGLASVRPFSLLEYLDQLHMKLEQVCEGGLILEEPTDKEGTVILTDPAHRELLQNKVDQTPYLHSVGRVVVANQHVLHDAEEARRAKKPHWWAVFLDSVRG